MISYPNQRKIIIQKEKCDIDNIYAKINLEALNNAMINLSDKGKLLWLYFAKNANKYSFYLSMIDSLNFLGSESSYRRAFAELVSKGFLKHTQKNEYIFIEFPKEEEKKDI